MAEQKTSARYNILLATLGSAGDVHPMVSLGLALKKRGHGATIITNEIFGDSVRSAGLDFIQLGSAAEAREIISDPRLWHPNWGYQCVAERVIVPNISRLYEIIERCAGPGTILAASGVCFGARIAQEKLGTPLATVHLQPTIIRSLVDSGKYGPIPMGPTLPSAIKRSMFWLLDTLAIDRFIVPDLNRFRAKLTLGPVYRVLDSYAHSPQLVLCLFPDWFAPPQPDWPPNTHQPGFVLYDASDIYKVPASVEEFLAAGSPPVVFTPGSAAATLPEFFRESVEACRIAGLRGLLVTMHPNQLPRELPDDVRSFSYLPFSQILPRCAAITYHGGIGTMAQAIKAAIPHLVVPHSYDQPDNGFRIERLGLGCCVSPRRYRASEMASTLRQLVDSGDIRERCREYSAKIESAAALREACDWIERLA
ncbi:MAG TPA: glycosyltransferase [Candidatus Acidoferrales bacterium]|nr:glycosyltransferase [Candidatus Acidoferrales bacterium]